MISENTNLTPTIGVRNKEKTKLTMWLHGQQAKTSYGVQHKLVISLSQA